MMNKHEEMQKYFAAIMKIAESDNEESCQAIHRVCIDASNFFEHNFPEEETVPPFKLGDSTGIRQEKMRIKE